MAKRTATTELTDRNWDHEDEPEEAGQFVQASSNTIKQRQIIKAKRKSSTAEGGSRSFTGFSGFSFKPTSTSTPFSFNVKSVTNGQSETKETAASVIPPVKGVPAPNPVKSTPASNGSAKTESGDSVTCNAYSENLKKLNESVLSWIQKHVEKNAYCILTPIFKDYEKHLDELEKEKSEKTGKNNGMESKTATTFSTVTTGVEPALSSTKPAFSFGTSATATPSSGFSFGSTKAASAPSDGTKGANGGSTFGATVTGFSGFNLQSNLGTKPSPFFAVGQSTGAMGSSQDAAEEEYEPPKPESTEVKEEGALHTIKCKLFYQKDGAWKERGVGFLHLKKADDKIQLVVRADTSLGNILLNIILSSSLPLSRQGKNNVSIMCVPNPPLDTKEDPKATPMLIRVKTPEDADTLLEKMKELRK
ncbi:nuclear pore complex protein Nup50-like [Mizuhopecten yessoensis]|uniref:Nuclear pore complex protein Nup50 n=1 Tax=Mizuhopecten yessoensis TaxID=6573 RepID=A0A210QPK6_MIZYE|nr:nuclear pore complex protein Nup50-like [Mizuhopecten yessoensis]OWF50667.1 Nuclear pore complex protein Nup50 [Mizuhopecten yessoensis]